MASFFNEDVQKVLSLKQISHDYVEQVEDEDEMLEKLVKIIEENNTTYCSVTILTSLTSQF